MRTPEAVAIERAISARENGNACTLDIHDDDAAALAEHFADHTAGMAPADAMAEALIIGIIAGWHLGSAPPPLPACSAS